LVTHRCQITLGLLAIVADRDGKCRSARTAPLSKPESADAAPAGAGLSARSGAKPHPGKLDPAGTAP
jgi:hypothetical protein